jgi:hypothetical protein
MLGIQQQSYVTSSSNPRGLHVDSATQMQLRFARVLAYVNNLAAITPY